MRLIALQTITIDFWLWWCRELDLIFSKVWESWLFAPSHVIQIDKKSWSIHRVIDGAVREIKRIPKENLENEIESDLKQAKSSRSSAVIIELNQSLGLYRTIDLPLSAKADLDKLLHYELDHLTPFSAEDVYLTFHIAGSDETRQQMNVEFAVVPKAIMDDVLSILKRHRLSATRIELQGIQGLDFSRLFRAKTKRVSLLRRIPIVLVLFFLILGGLIFLRILDQEERLQNLESEVTLVRSQVEEYSTKKRQYDDLRGTAQQLEAERAGKPAMTEMLAELTELIPDDAHLVQLVIDDRTVQLYGFAGKASAIITALEQSPSFTAPRFDSPLTMDSEAGLERFHIVTQIISGSGDA